MMYTKMYIDNDRCILPRLYHISKARRIDITCLQNGYEGHG